MFFDNWYGILRVVLVGTIAYVALVILLRVTGKRTLSKLNAFDLVVTVALGSTLATVLLTKDVALLEGITAFTLLVGLQWGITWLSVRSSMIAGFVKSEPTLLYIQGRFLPGAMQRERVTQAEVLAAVRNEGLAEMESVLGVVLETDGGLTVLHADTTNPKGAQSALEGVRRS